MYDSFERGNTQSDRYPNADDSRIVKTPGSKTKGNGGDRPRVECAVQMVSLLFGLSVYFLGTISGPRPCQERDGRS